MVAVERRVDGVAAVPRADAHLQVQGLGRHLPHLVEPVLAVRGFGLQGGRRGVAQCAFACVEHDVAIGGGVGELQVVAGVVPTACCVHRWCALDLDEWRASDKRVVARGVNEVRGLIDGCVCVVQVGGLPIQWTSDDVGAVSLHLVEVDAVEDDLPVEAGRALDREGRRLRTCVAVHGQVIRAERPESAERDVVHVGVVRVPRPTVGGADGAMSDDVIRAIDDVPRRVLHPVVRHQVRVLRVAWQVAHLVDAHLRRGCRLGGHSVRWRGRQRPERDTGEQHGRPPGD